MRAATSVVEIGPSIVSTSSGMWLKLIESDVSISSMMFGFTWAELVLVMGVLEMSVWAACSGETAKDSAATPQPRKRPAATTVRVVFFLSMTLPSGRQVLANHDLDVAQGLLRTDDPRRDPVVNDQPVFAGGVRMVPGARALVRTALRRRLDADLPRV